MLSHFVIQSHTLMKCMAGWPPAPLVRYVSVHARVQLLPRPSPGSSSHRDKRGWCRRPNLVMECVGGGSFPNILYTIAMAEKVYTGFRPSLQNIESELREINNPHQLGIHLGVPPEDLERFEKENRNDVIRQRAEVINYWLKNNDATWEALARAMEKVGGHKNLVTRLRSLADHTVARDVSEGTGDEAKGPYNQESVPEGSKSTNSESECSEPEKDIYQHILAKDKVIKTDIEAKKNLPSEKELESETLKIMKFDFNTLMTTVRLSLEKQEIRVESLLCHLQSIEAIGPSIKPVYVGHSKPLKTVATGEYQSIKEVFVALAPYCSWFNHLIIENIMETFCDEDEGLKRKWREFQDKVREYCKRRVIECPENQYGECDDKSEVRETVVMKVDHNWATIRVDQLFHIRNSVANVLEIKPLHLYLCTVEKGCIKMLFYIPNYTVSRISYTAKTKAALGNIGVTDVTYGWETEVPRKRRRLMSAFDYNVMGLNSYPVSRSGSTAFGQYPAMRSYSCSLKVTRTLYYIRPAWLGMSVLLLLVLHLPQPYNYYGILITVIGAVLLLFRERRY